MTILLTLLVGAFAGQTANAFSSKYLSCQTIDAAPASALNGCPKNTVFVSATDSRASYKSVQQAVEAM